MNTIRNIFKIFSLLFLGILLLIILSGVVLYKAEFCIVRHGDTAILLQQNLPHFFLGLTIAIGFYIILWLVTGRYRPQNVWKYGWILLLMNLILQIAVIFFFRVELTADWQVIYNLSKELITGNFSSLQKEGYFYAYPHNIGLALYFAVLDFINPSNIYILRVLNIFYSLITILFINKIFITLTPDYKRHRGRFFIFSVFFLPAIFMSNLVYNEVLSTMFFTIAIYYSIRFINQQRIRFLIVIALLLTLGHFIRGVGYIFAVAILLYFFLMKVHWQKILLFILCLIIGFSYPLLIMNYKLLLSDKILEPLGENSAPLTKWINIGLNKKHIGYWDQGESYWMYARDAKWNKQEATKLYYQSLENKVKEYGLKEIANIYYQKIVWLWTEGTYQSIYLGMSHTNPGGYMEVTPVSKYFEEDLNRREIFKIPMYYGNIISLTVILIFITYVIFTRKWQLFDKEMIFVLIILGFISFYVLWEVKPRYIFPVFPYLLLLSYISVVKLIKPKDD